MLTRSALILASLCVLASLCLLSACTSGELVRNASTPCGDPELVQLYENRNRLSEQETLRLDSLIDRCLQSRPCDHPRISEIIMQERKLTREEYRELYTLSDDCDNWNELAPISTWGVLGIAYLAFNVVVLTIGIRLLSGK